MASDGPRPNLLFIMTDHQRADSLGMTQAGVEVRYSSAETAVWPGPAEHFKDMYWCREAARFVKERPGDGRPFALFLLLWAPHPPLRLPEPSFGRGAAPSGRAKAGRAGCGGRRRPLVLVAEASLRLSPPGRA